MVFLIGPTSRRNDLLVARIDRHVKVVAVDKVGNSEARERKAGSGAQGSSFELALLFYNCLSDIGRDKFKPLIDRYALLKTLSRDRLVDAHHVELYDSSAYGS